MSDLLLNAKWHERCPEDGEYICGGMFRSARPIISTFIGNRRVIRCSGTHGAFIDADSIGNLCLTCDKRVSASPSAVLKANDNMHMQSASILRGARCPYGCPHMLEEDRREAQASVLLTLKSIGTSTFPYSWRIYKHEDNNAGTIITLAIQYRTVFINASENKTASSSCYQNISANISTGQTYVGNVHGRTGEGIVLYDNAGKSKCRMMNITYGADAMKIQSFMHFLPQDYSIEPLSAFLKTTVSELHACGLYDKSAPPAYMLPYNKPDERFTHQHGRFTLLLYASLINRFPMLCSSFTEMPYHLEYACGTMTKRMRNITHGLPRSIRPEELSEYAGLNDPLCRKELTNHPENLAIAIFLDECGCSPEQISYLHYLTGDSDSNGYVATPIRIPIAGAYRASCARSIESLIKQNSNTKKHGKGVDYVQTIIMTQCTRKTSLDDIRTMIQQSASTYGEFGTRNGDYIANLLELGASSTSAYDEIFSRLDDKFTKKKLKWNIMRVSENEPRRYVLIHNGEQVARIGLCIRYALDRRRWSTADSEELLAKSIASPDKLVNRKLAEAFNISYELQFAYSLKEDLDWDNLSCDCSSDRLPIRSAVPHAIYEWCCRNNVALSETSFITLFGSSNDEPTKMQKLYSKRKKHEGKH